MGLSAALSSAGHALQVFSAGIEVAGQNIANAGTPGYIREELQVEPGFSYQSGNLLFGTGVSAMGIQQQIDTFLEQRIYIANADLSHSTAQQAIFQQLEVELRELGTGDLSSRVNDFLSSLHEVVNQPESTSVRQLAVAEGSRLAEEIRSLHTRVNRLRHEQSDRLTGLVGEANALIDQIGHLNLKISRAEVATAYDSHAGGLRSQRYEALNRLSEIIPIRVLELPGGAVEVHSGSNTVISGNLKDHLEVVSEVRQGVTVTVARFENKGMPIPQTGGEIQGVIDARDTVLGGFVQQLDAFTENLIATFNRLHSSGQGLKGFETLTAQTAVTDSAAALNVAGLPLAPEHGGFLVTLTNASTGITKTHEIAVDLNGIGGDTSLDDLAAALNAVDHLSASISTDGRLQLQAAGGYQFQFADDSSGVLAALGLNTFFTGSNAGDIGINSLLATDHSYLATARGGGPSDGSNAARFAEFANLPIEGLAGASLDDFYESLVASVAQQSSRSTALAEGFHGFLQSLENQRSQYSGVSMDEEAIKMLQFQKSFQAAARMVSTIDELFTTLLNM